jgi:hypothetical protein
MLERADNHFYRILEDATPTLRDFLSYEALGRQPRRRTPDVLPRWTGISMYGTETQARAVADWRPAIGRYIASVRIEASAPIQWEQTGDPDSGHYTLWGDAAEFLRRVVDVVPV